jgi:hypothetical protein
MSCFLTSSNTNDVQQVGQLVVCSTLQMIEGAYFYNLKKDKELTATLK